MPEVATGASGGQRRRRQPLVYAGEVTKATTARVEDEEAEDPPEFSGPKIGGIAETKLHGLDVLSATTSGQQPNGILNIGGVQVAKPEPAVSSRNGPRHPFAACPGWGRVWASVSRDDERDWNGHPDVSMSTFCKQCVDDGEYCNMTLASLDRSGQKCGRCVRGRHECLRIVSYRKDEKEAMSVDDIPNYNIRTLARLPLGAVSTAHEIPDACTSDGNDTSTSRLQWQRIRQASEKSKLEVTTQPSQELRNSEPPSTYSRIRTAYEDLVKNAYRNPVSNPSRNGPEEPFWETHEESMSI